MIILDREQTITGIALIPRCLSCNRPAPVRRGSINVFRLYCGNACRQRAYRRRSREPRTQN